MRMLVIANAWGEMRMRGGRELFNQAGLPALEPPEEEGENSIHLPFSLSPLERGRAGHPRRLVVKRGDGGGVHEEMAA